jgi:hypothetical protein
MRRLGHAGKHTCTRSSQVNKTQAKGIKIQAKTAKCKNGENLKFMADQGSLQQSTELATGRYYSSVRTAQTIVQNTSVSVLQENSCRTSRIALLAINVEILRRTSITYQYPRTVHEYSP